MLEPPTPAFSVRCITHVEVPILFSVQLGKNWFGPLLPLEGFNLWSVGRAVHFFQEPGTQELHLSQFLLLWADMHRVSEPRKVNNRAIVHKPAPRHHVLRKHIADPQVPLIGLHG